MAPLKQDLLYLQLADLRVSPLNARYGVEEEDTQDWDEFKADIKEKGILQPLLAAVAAEGEGYEVLDGARRLAAMMELHPKGDASVPCEVVDEKEAVERALLSMSSTGQRRQLTPLQSQAAIARLKKMGMNQATIAKRLHRSPAWVSAMALGHSFSEQHRKSSESKSIPTAREFEDVACPCGCDPVQTLAVELADGRIRLTVRERESVDDLEAKRAKRRAKKK